VLAVGWCRRRIVIVENVERHLHAGEAPIPAALHAARERWPIIAMTITLADVYAPIGIQGGLTGRFSASSPSRWPARSSSPAWWLSRFPMMGTRLLRPGDTQKGFAGWINRRSTRFVRVQRLLGDAGLPPRGSRFWVIVLALMAPFYLLSQKELAPAEDQGVVFGIVQASANSTLDRRSFSCRASRGV